MENAPGARGPVLAPGEGFGDALCVFWGSCLVPVAGRGLCGGSSARPPAPPALGAASDPAALGASPPFCIDGGCVGKGWGALNCPHGKLPPWQGHRQLASCVVTGLQVGALFSSKKKKKNKGTACTGAGGGLLSQTSQLYTKVCSRICTAVNNYNWFL